MTDDRGRAAAIEESSAPTPALGHQVSRALGWSSLAQILGRVGNFAVGIVLARLLTQDDFGAYAVTLVAVNLLIVINDLGVIAAVIRWQGDVERAARTGATLSIAFSATAFALACAAAGPFARVMGVPDAANLVRVVSVVVLIDGLTAAHQAILVRTFRNDRLAFAELAGFLTSMPVTVALAVAGVGPWSVVAGRVVGAAAVGVMVVRYAPFSIRPAYERQLAGALVRFGAPLALSAVVSQAVLNVDYVLVGRELGATQLGIYLLAFNLSGWPASLVSTAIARVAFAGFSRLVEDRDRLHTAFPRSIGVAVMVLVPLVAMIGVLAPEIISLVYGDRWSSAATPLRFLIVLGGLRILIDLLIDLSIAEGRSSTALAVRSLWLVALVPAMAVGAATGGLQGVGIAHLAVGMGVVFPLMLWDARRSGFSPRDLGQYAVRPILAGGAATVAMLAVLPLVGGDISRLVVVGAVGTACYLVAVVPRNPLIEWVVSRVRPSPAL